MNFVSPQSGHESVVSDQNTEPHAERRAVRLGAADIAVRAIERQFPGLFLAQVATQGVATQPEAPITMENEYVPQIA